MKFLLILFSTLLLLNLIPLSCSDVTFEIRSDIHVAIRLSMRPSPIKTIKGLGTIASQYFKNLRDILNALSSKDLTPPSRSNFDSLQEHTKKSYLESSRFFSNDFLTVWYNQLRRNVESNYVFTEMYTIIENFLTTMTTKKAPRCWNRNRESVKKVAQYHVVTKAYIDIEKYMLTTFSGYKDESQVFLNHAKKIGPGNSASFYLTKYYGDIINLITRWMNEIDNLKWDNNQASSLKQILDESFKKTLPEFENSLANATACASAVKPKPDAPGPNPPDVPDSPDEPAPDVPGPDVPGPDSPAPEENPEAQ